MKFILMFSIHALPTYLRMFMGLFLSLSLSGTQARTEQAPASIVFYYGDEPVASQLSRFDLAVVEPGTDFLPSEATETETNWFAYVSIGEASPWRDYYAEIPQSWIVGHNGIWNADIIDQTAQGWPQFVADRIIAPLWNKGYTGFFLDTLDSYQLLAHDALDRQESQAGLVAVIKAIRTRFPTARLIFNRGFELLPDVHEHVYALAFESLFSGWSEARGVYVDVPEADRQWLLDRATEATQKYGLPVIAIDYCPPAKVQCSLDTARRIRALGMIPYVGDAHLQQVNEALLE